MRYLVLASASFDEVDRDGMYNLFSREVRANEVDLGSAGVSLVLIRGYWYSFKENAKELLDQIDQLPAEARPVAFLYDLPYTPRSDGVARIKASGLKLLADTIEKLTKAGIPTGAMTLTKEQVEAMRVSPVVKPD